MSRADSAEYYVVLAGGVQRINEVTADLIRFSDSQGAQEIVTVAPDVIAGHPSLNLLAVQTFPDRAGKIVDVPEKSVLCSSWKPGQEKTQEHASTKLLMGSSLPLKTDQVPVVLAQADKEGPNLDTAYIPPARSAFVRSTGLGGGHRPGGVAVPDPRYRRALRYRKPRGRKGPGAQCRTGTSALAHRRVAATRAPAEQGRRPRRP